MSHLFHVILYTYSNIAALFFRLRKHTNDYLLYMNIITCVYINIQLYTM